MDIINLVLIITFTLTLQVIQAEEIATEPSYNPLEHLILNDNNAPTKDHARMKRQYDPYYYDRGYYPVPIIVPIGLGFGGGFGRGFPGRGFGGRGFGGRGFGGRGFSGRGLGGRGFGGRGFCGIGGRGVGGIGGGRGGRG